MKRRNLFDSIFTTVTTGLYANDKLPRSGWGSGPWDTEQFDWAVWTDIETGLECALKRNGAGSWAGYVLIPTSHPINQGLPPGSDFLQDARAATMRLEVHGGVTFHGPWDLEEMDIQGFAVGFDCAHWRDKCPGVRSEGTYCTAHYAMREVQSLARQINEYAPLAQLSGTQHQLTEQS